MLVYLNVKKIMGTGEEICKKCFTDSKAIIFQGIITLCFCSFTTSIIL